MAKILFLPFSLLGGLLAGILGKRAFSLVWGWIDDQEPPTPEKRGARLGKLALALTLQGAVFRVTRGLVDHGSRRGFERVTGSWPGEKQDDPDQD